ncbi:MAG: NAD(P)/FAD-dependent oxidoreductase [Chitinophagales bacterium]|nr:NAD(P)/FAD-dependent oxidoreductase [Chitinophagales bacterium]MCO5281623.1 NAD(P)/FAD-dependent oxidoreductase [Chitinophagales bacterium]OJV27751.1 MAG: FAD-dependent oxidoreductase [Bacteroidetes bacterium 37-13]
MVKSKHVKSFLTHKPSDNFDVIVVGSGMGGTATAALLAKEGKRVLVLEQHYTAGGFTHAYMRRGYLWDVGIHYVGEMQNEKNLMTKLFKYLSNDQLKWADMGEVYDKMIFGKEVYDYAKGKEEFKAKLKTYFPEPNDQLAIDHYVQAIYDAQRAQMGFFTEKLLPRFLQPFLSTWLRKKALKWNKTTLEVLQSITQNRKLIAVLTGQFGDYGLPPAESSFMMHAILAKHYMRGGNYPVGGAGKIFETIAPAICEAGGEIFVNAPVKEIILKNNKAIGVKMESGEEYFAPTIVSNTGINTTFKKLLPKEIVQQNHLDKKLTQLTPSVGHVCLYIGLRHSKSSLNLGKANYWIFPDNYDHDLNIKNYLANPDSEIPVVYISFPSAKDPAWEAEFPERSTIEIVTLAPYEWYAAWSNQPWKKRGQDYEAQKEKLSQRLLEKLFEQEPQLRDKIDYYELSTPLSTKHFTNYEVGELYGINHDVKRFSQTFLRPKSPIKNLYLTGQDIVSCGVGGALSAGLLTASAITGKNLMKRLK